PLHCGKPSAVEHHPQGRDFPLRTGRRAEAAGAAAYSGREILPVYAVRGRPLPQAVRPVPPEPADTPKKIQTVLRQQEPAGLNRRGARNAEQDTWTHRRPGAHGYRPLFRAYGADDGGLPRPGPPGGHPAGIPSIPDRTAYILDRSNPSPLPPIVAL